MANVKGQSRATSDLFADSSSFEYVKSLKDGTLSMLDFYHVMNLEGRVFTADAGGVATTSLTAAGAYDANGADYVLDVPSETTIMPITLDVVVDTLTDDEDIELIFYAANLANTKGTATDVTVYNNNLTSSRGSTVAAYAAADAAGSTDVTGATRLVMMYRSFAELGSAPAAAQSEEGFLDIGWHVSALKGDFIPPIIPGVGSLTRHIAKTTAAKFFCSVKWIELPTAWFS